MGALDVALGFLESQPWPVRCRYTVRRQGHTATVHRGGMQVGVSETGDGRVAVVYEHALHEVTRECLPPEVAGRFVLLLVQRDCLCPVAVPDF